MNNSDYYKVLWVEDDQRLTRTLPRKAEKHWLDLRPFPCWDDAQEALIRDFDSWDAIILDAKCKHHRDSRDNAAEFLREALMEIRAICREKGRQLNWYILTGEGGSETESINEHIPDERMKWDGDWTERTGKKFYSKVDKEVESLFMRVKYFASQSERTQIKTLLYRDVFDAIQYCKISDEASDMMTDLLFNLHRNIEGKEANNIMWEARKIMEHIFRSMIDEWGMLPVDFISTDKKEKVNLSSAARMLGGDSTDNDKKTKSYLYPQPIINSILKYQIIGIVTQTGEYLHTDKKSGPSSTTELLASVNNSPYLVYGMTMNLCNIILWFKNYIMFHPNPKENLKNWIVENKENNAH